MPHRKHTDGPIAERIAHIGNQFAISGDFLYGEELCNGHINTTYRACYRSEDGLEERYILQRINDYVFKDPAQVMRNVEKVTRHITWKLMRRRGRCNAGQILTLYPARGGRNYIVLPEEGGMWRCYNNIEGTHTYDVVENTRQAYQAGYAFGSFQELVSDMNPEDIKESIPDFHNTAKRYQKLLESVAADVKGRAADCQAELELLAGWADRYSKLTDMQARGEIPTRITHNDTKINNVMLDEESDQAVCVIDLDTVMPGLIGHDFGDAIRFAANYVEEDCPDAGKAGVNLEVFRAFAEGFLSQTARTLTETEVDTLALSCFVLTAELATRFLADYLDGDLYFKVRSPEHNLIRAHAQMKLLEDIESKYDELCAITEELINE